MLEHLEYEDVKVADLMAHGFPIVGDLDKTGIFEPRPPHEVDQGAGPEWLWRSAREARQTLRRSMERQEIDKITRDLYRLTVTDSDSEVKREWTRGPFVRRGVDKEARSSLPARKALRRRTILQS